LQLLLLLKKSDNSPVLLLEAQHLAKVVKVSARVELVFALTQLVKIIIYVPLVLATKLLIIKEDAISQKYPVMIKKLALLTSASLTLDVKTPQSPQVIVMIIILARLILVIMLLDVFIFRKIVLILILVLLGQNVTSILVHVLLLPTFVPLLILV
jgi:hypothetical protein